MKKTILQKAIEYEKLVPQKPNAVNFTVVEHFGQLDPEKRFEIQAIFVPGFMFTSSKSPYAALQTDEEHKERLKIAAQAFLDKKKSDFIAGGCVEPSKSLISKVKALKSDKKLTEAAPAHVSAPKLVHMLNLPQRLL